MDNNKSGQTGNQPHRPDCVMIDAYGNGGFRFDNMSHKGNLLISPLGMFPWQTAKQDIFSIEEVTPYISALAQADILLLGMGKSIKPLPKEMVSWFEERGLYPDVMDTGAAARTYNVLFMEKRSISALLFCVD